MLHWNKQIDDINLTEMRGSRFAVRFAVRNREPNRIGHTVPNRNREPNRGDLRGRNRTGNRTVNRGHGSGHGSATVRDDIWPRLEPAGSGVEFCVEFDFADQKSSKLVIFIRGGPLWKSPKFPQIRDFHKGVPLWKSPQIMIFDEFHENLPNLPKSLFKPI